MGLTALKGWNAANGAAGGENEYAGGRSTAPHWTAVLLLYIPVYASARCGILKCGRLAPCLLTRLPRAWLAACSPTWAEQFVHRGWGHVNQSDLLDDTPCESNLCARHGVSCVLLPQRAVLFPNTRMGGRGLSIRFWRILTVSRWLAGPAAAGINVAASCLVLLRFFHFSCTQAYLWGICVAPVFPCRADARTLLSKQM